MSYRGVPESRPSNRVTRLLMSESANRPLTIPWGPGEALDLRPPAGWRLADVAEPDLSGALGDYPGALAVAMDGMEPALDSVARGPVAIVIDDPSRWTPVREALPIVLDRLERAGVPRGSISLSIGVGRHKAVDQQSMDRRLGPELARRVAWQSPPVDDLSAYDDLGTTSAGIPVRVFRPVARAATRILIGSVLPHLQAGFGGGEKLIFPGCSHRSTLAALHRVGIGPNDDVAELLGSDPDANPMRRAIREAFALLPGTSIAVNHLMGDRDQVLRVEVGALGEVQRVLSDEARARFQAPFRPPADVIAVGNAPWPGDPMQSFKALLHHRAACRPGGVMIGFFWADPEELARSMPEGALRAIAATGGIGEWAIRHGVAGADAVARKLGHPASFMIHWARELVVNRTVLVYSPLLAGAIGKRLGPVRLFGDQGKLWEAAEAAIGRDGARNPAGQVRLRIFPRGGLTYCRQKAAADSLAPPPLLRTPEGRS